MSDDIMSIIERAKAEADRLIKRDTLLYGSLYNPDGDEPYREGFERGATFAATITAEQIEAGARAIQAQEDADGMFAGIEWCRESVRFTARAMGFIVEGGER